MATRSLLLPLRARVRSQAIRTYASSAEAQAIPDRLIGSREEIARKKVEVELKYAEKLRLKMEEQKVDSLEDLKRKTITPLHYRDSPPAAAPKSPQSIGVGSSASKSTKSKPMKSQSPQAKGDRAGVKPLSDILNLPLLFSPPSTTTSSRPHSTHEITSLWQSYHSLHPTLSSTFLSAAIPPHLYAGMVDLGREHPIFVLPLPREVGVDAVEMFYLQWLFHPTPDLAGAEVADPTHAKLPITSVLFTPLEEFKQKGEWAQPHLVLSHYPDLYNVPPSLSADSKLSLEPSDADPTPVHHPVILMRGEIPPSPTASALSASLPGNDLALSQADAQLLALALQRFYASAAVEPAGAATVGPKEQESRRKRRQVLSAFKKGDWDLETVKGLAFGGVV